MSGWIGVDLDGTLAEYGGWKGADHIGAPVPLMLERVKAWVAAKQEVRIFTARVNGVFPASESLSNAIEIGGMNRMFHLRDQVGPIRDWCVKHVGCVLTVTNRKDFGMIELWDDRAVGVVPNTGRRADGKEEPTIPYPALYNLDGTVPELSASKRMSLNAALRQDVARALQSERMTLSTTPSREHKHRCMRCGQEFDCLTPGICQAQYDVLPNIVTPEGNVIEHCQAGSATGTKGRLSSRELL